MNFLRTRNLRLLYWLALAQLVGGPLVLLQVTVFCKLTLHEAPRVGISQAAVQVWQSDGFQAVWLTPDVPRSGDTKKSAPSDGQKLKLEKAKLPVIPWERDSLALDDVSGLRVIADYARVWTPIWPQAPPGPPPRVG